MNEINDKGLRPVTFGKSIRGRFFLFSEAVLLVTIILISLFIVNTNKSQIVSNIRVENLSIAEDAVKRAELYMDTIIADLLSISRTLVNEEGVISTNNRPEMGRLMDKIREILVLSVFDVQGNELLSVPRDGQISKVILNEEMGDKRIASLLEENIHIGNVYTGTQGVPVIDISVPITTGAEHQVKGILAVVINLNGLYKRLEGVTLKRGQKLYIVDRNGWSIASLSRSGQNIQGGQTIVPQVQDIGNVMKVQQYLSGISELSLGKPLIYKNIDQEEVLGVLALCPKLKWGVIAEEKLSVILEQMSPIIKKYSLGAGLIFICISLLCAVCIRFITAPVIRLYKFTEGLGEEMQRISFRGTDEIGRIAQNINGLIKELTQKEEDLRRRYKELDAIHREYEQSYNQLEQVTDDLETSRQHLLKEKEFTNRLIEAVNLLIVGLNLEGTVVIFNHECEKRLLYSSEEMVGKNWYETVYPLEQKAVAMRHFQDVLEGKGKEATEENILTREGTTITIAWHATLVSDSKGTPEYIIMIGENRGEKQKMEEELRAKNLQLIKNNEELENILSIVSHDLKNPLYILQDFASILIQDYQDRLNEDGLYYLKRIKANAQHMENLIKDLLELSRSSRVKGAWQESPVSDIVNRALEEFNEVIKARGIKVILADNFPFCICEPERILQVFMNLLSNSIKFIDNLHPPIIEIGYQDKQNEYEFYVRDNGIGIDKEYHEKIFVIFQRLNDLKGVEGSGVGLTIVKKIVEDHGGRVWVESKKGEGATFYFTLPRVLPK